MTHWIVEKNKSLFLETGNPLYAWKAFEHARGLKSPVPHEVMEYIWEAAHELMHLASQPPAAAKRPIAIAKAFKLHKNGVGQGSAFTDFSRRLRDREIALATAKKVDEWGQGKRDYAFEDIAKEYGISKSTVHRNFLEHSERWHLIAQQLIESGAVKFEKDKMPQLQLCGTADDLREAAEILREVKELFMNYNKS